MRVLSSVLDPRFGGPPQRSLSVARELRAEGIETIFLIPQGDDSFADAATGENFEVVRIDQPRIRSPENVEENVRFLLGFRSCTRQAKAILDEYDIDVAHVNGPLNYPVALAAHRSNAALVWHFNDILTPLPLRKLSSYMARRWADEIVVAADAVKKKFFPPSVHTRTIYAPVDFGEYDPAQVTATPLHEELALPERSQIVGAIGNINPIKGHEFLIQSVPILQERCENVHVIIAGAELDSQSEYVEGLRELCSDLDIGNSVHFLGWRDDIPELLAAFDVFVLPSLSEACPIVVLEAMAMGCPVVATDVGGVPEQIPSQDHGWVIPPEAPDCIAAAVGDALKAPDERQRRSKNAHERAVRLFSLETCVERHLDAYRTALES